MLNDKLNLKVLKFVIVRRACIVNTFLKTTMGLDKHKIRGKFVNSHNILSFRREESLNRTTDDILVKKYSFGENPSQKPSEKAICPGTKVHFTILESDTFMIKKEALLNTYVKSRKLTSKNSSANLALPVILYVYFIPTRIGPLSAKWF